MRINALLLCDAIRNIKLCTNRAEILYNQKEIIIIKKYCIESSAIENEKSTKLHYIQPAAVANVQKKMQQK